ncbi:NAD+ diphosphatase [Jatrophihabitans sp. GAS493]|uniref:NAD(+) diphosphatase n=1 Tax=Jatrophihabitans sp. GAS493 TaxID=1907575 RepID=UPI000BB97F4E|nr:NAD(+) diphosphatase [Jatrophihabitans sp. GAS493]SOD73184.1 NAD+ diphosphatase [Jatrophihabitans sp. GAS493]
MENQPPLSRATFDRAALHRTDDAWLAAAWDRAKVALLNQRGATPTSKVDGGWQPVWSDASWVARFSDDHPSVLVERRFLGIIDDVPYFSATLTAEADDEDWRGLREIGGAVDDLTGSLLATALGLQQWHARHPHCALCGELTVQTLAGWTRTCPRDSSVHFPRTDPAVIMLIHDGGDRALLGRGAAWGVGRFSTLAGFVEPGESLEAAVAREVFEEVGVRVGDIRYVASQPWPFPASLMVGFTARAIDDGTIELDDDEVVDAGWFTREEVRQAGVWTDDPAADSPENGSRLRAIPPQFSISRHLIDGWLESE